MILAAGRAALLTVLLAQAAPALACRVERRAELPAAFPRGLVELPATVDGESARFLLDTGSENMLVTPGAAARLGLAPDPARRTLLLGTGGDAQAPNAWLAGVRLGGVALARRSVAVAPLPGPVDADGLLGAPLAAAYDLDLDLVAGKVGLVSVEGCAAGAPLLPPPFTVVRLTVTADGTATVPVTVNGVTLTALLDTGSAWTALTPAAARRAHVGPLGPGGTAPGVDGAPVGFQGARAATLAVGWDVQRGVEVAVAPLRIGGADMLLGADWLRQRHAWVSYATGQLVIALAYAWR